MHISVEISYYPLVNNYEQAIIDLLEIFNQQNTVSIEVGSMSTIINGEYDAVMEILNSSMKSLMQKYPSVFNLKIANACEI